MDGWIDTATDPYELAGIARRIPMDTVIEHSREHKGRLCNIDTCPICKQRYADWEDEMRSEISRSYAD